MRKPHLTLRLIQLLDHVVDARRNDTNRMEQTTNLHCILIYLLSSPPMNQHHPPTSTQLPPFLFYALSIHCSFFPSRRSSDFFFNLFPLHQERVDGFLRS